LIQGRKSELKNSDDNNEVDSDDEDGFVCVCGGGGGGCTIILGILMRRLVSKTKRINKDDIHDCDHVEKIKTKKKKKFEIKNY